MIRVFIMPPSLLTSRAREGGVQRRTPPLRDAAGKSSAVARHYQTMNYDSRDRQRRFQSS